MNKQPIDHLRPSPRMLAKLHKDFEGNLEVHNPTQLVDKELRAGFVGALGVIHGPKMPQYYSRINATTGMFDSAVSEQQYQLFKAGYMLGRMQNE